MFCFIPYVRPDKHIIFRDSRCKQLRLMSDCLSLCISFFFFFFFLVSGLLRDSLSVKSVCPGQICLDNLMCCHTDTNWTSFLFCPATDACPTRPSTDPWFQAPGKPATRIPVLSHCYDSNEEQLPNTSHSKQPPLHSGCPSACRSR